MLRTILGLLAGVVAAMVLVGVVEMATHAIWPPPAGLDLRSMEDATAVVAAMPFAAKFGVVLAGFLGALGGAAVATRVSRKAWPAWVIGLLLAAGGVYSIVTIPHPAWMNVASVVAPLLGAWLGERLGRRLEKR